MTLFVFGAGGQVGRALIERAGASAIGADRHGCDICDEAAVTRALADPALTAVVNCAAFTAVERAQSEPVNAFAVNAGGAAIVARAAAARRLPLIHLSTDYVYAGAGREPHCEEEPAAPLNVYGASKAAGDAAVATTSPAHLVLRTSWVFGVYGANFVKTMLRLARERDELRIVADQIGGPTEARDIADAVLAMAAICRRPGFSAWGIYHFAGAPSTSWHGFAQAIFECAPPPPRLLPVASSEYPTAVVRPANSTLNCNRIGDVFGITPPDWRASLARVMAEQAEMAR